MAHHAIEHLRLRPGVDWNAVETRFAELARALADHAELRALSVIRVDPVSATVMARFVDADAGQRISRDVIRPWIHRELASFMAEPVSSIAGDSVLEFTRVDAQSASMERLEGPDRLAHLANEAAESGALWGLYDETWARSPAASGAEALPFWPTLESAARCIDGDWASYSPRRIALEPFLGQWLTGMQEDGIVAVVSPTPNDPGFVVEAERLEEALRNAAARAEGAD